MAIKQMQEQKDSKKKKLHLMHKAITVDVRTSNNRFSAIL